MARPGRWWSRSRGLPGPVHDAWSASLRSDLGAEARILAWAAASDADQAEGPAYAIGSPTALSVGGDDGWHHVAWDQIERGDWNSETSRLSWAEYGGRRGSVALGEPARLPELFRERIAASIVVEQFVRVRGERGITVHGRRRVGVESGPITWHASLGRGLTWAVPGLREAADAAIEDLRREYDPAPERW